MPLLDADNACKVLQHGRIVLVCFAWVYVHSHVYVSCFLWLCLSLQAGTHRVAGVVRGEDQGYALCLPASLHGGCNLFVDMVLCDL